LSTGLFLDDIQGRITAEPFSGGMLMNRTDKCPNCGSLNIGDGVWTGYAALMPKGKKLSMGSSVNVKVCKECGHLFGFCADKPEKF